MAFKPFTAHIELPREVRRHLHRSQIFLSLSPGDETLLRIAIVPNEKRFVLRVQRGAVSPGGGDPEVNWLHVDVPEFGVYE